MRKPIRIRDMTPEEVEAFQAECAAKKAAELEAKNAHRRAYSHTYSERWHIENPEKARAMYRMRNYGITQEQWDTLFTSQGNKCGNPGCGATEPGGKFHWNTDHDHVTGEVRGILCHHCNRLLGAARDDIEHSPEGCGIWQ